MDNLFLPIEDDDLYMAMKNAPIKPRKKNKKLEKNEQDGIAKLFVDDGWEIIQYNSGKFELAHGGWFTANRNYNTGATSGHPDLRATKNCISVAIECKKPKGGIVSPAQIKYRENSLKYGNLTIICRTKESAREFINYTHNLDSIQEAVSWYMENYKQ